MDADADISKVAIGQKHVKKDVFSPMFTEEKDGRWSLQALFLRFSRNDGNLTKMRLGRTTKIRLGGRWKSDPNATFMFFSR